MPPRARPTGPGFEAYRWAATVEDVAARHGLSPAHVLRFDSNVPVAPAPLSVPADEALAERAEYPEGSYRELREAAASYAGCTAKEVTVEAGADGLIMLVARTFLGPGSRAVVEAPTYPLYAIASRIEGAEVDTENVGGAQVVWLCNPGNPSGALRPREEIVGLAESLPDTLVAVDEAYFEYCGETIAGAAPNLVCIRTLSKAFGLAGLRVGYAISSPDLAAELEARRSPAPIANAAAALAAASLRRPAFEADLVATLAERERMREALLAAGHDTPAVHANFVVVRMPDALAVGAELERRGLVVRVYPDMLRITVRSPADDDLILLALAIEPPPAARRSATVFRPGARASLVLEGSGRVRSATGDPVRDRRIEQSAGEAGFDLELVAERDTAEAGAALGEALARASALPATPQRTR